MERSADFRISVVVPAYNQERYIAATLDSILGQSYPALEVVVVDDGSTDGTPQVLDQYADRIVYKRIANSGVNRARNHGVRVARGEWLAFCDSDDIWRPDKLERQVALLRASGAEYSICDYTHYVDGVWEPRNHFSFAPAGFWDRARRTNYGEDGFLCDIGLAPHLAEFQPVIPAVPLLSRRLFENVGGWNEQLGRRLEIEDAYFHFSCFAAAPVAVVNGVLVGYRRHAENWSSDRLRQLTDGVAVWRLIIESHPAARDHSEAMYRSLRATQFEVAHDAFYHSRWDVFREALEWFPAADRPWSLRLRAWMVALPEPLHRSLRASVRMLRGSWRTRSSTA